MKKGLYNIFFGVLGQFVTIGLGVVVPRLVLVSFGSEINGLLNSITQIYAYFALLEAGIGTSTLQALYKPTAENNQSGINEILAATNIYYKRVAKIYLIAVLIFSSIYPCTVECSLPHIWVFFIILLNGLGSVINFWVQGKYVILLNAIGKNYININVSTVSSVLTSISKIILLMTGCDVLRLQLVYFVISILKMSFIYIYIKRNYQWIDLKVEPNYEALEQRNSVLVHQISTLIFNNIDILLITYFLGLQEVSVYSMYLMLFTYLNNLCNQVYGGFSYRLGQLYNANIERYKRFHDIFEVYYLTLVFAMYTIALIFVIPFLSLYTNGVNDVNYLDWKLAVLFFVLNLLSSGRASSIMVINFAGHFRNTVKQTIIESVINFSASIIFLNIFGIYGVLVGTIVALLYRMIDMVVYSNRILLNKSCFVTFKRWIFNIVVSLTVLMVIQQFNINLSSYGYLFIWAIILSCIITVVFILANSCFEYKVFREALKFIKGIKQGV